MRVFFGGSRDSVIDLADCSQGVFVIIFLRAQKCTRTQLKACAVLRANGCMRNRRQQRRMFLLFFLSFKNNIIVGPLEMVSKKVVTAVSEYYYRRCPSLVGEDLYAVACIVPELRAKIAAAGGGRTRSMSRELRKREVARATKSAQASGVLWPSPVCLCARFIRTIIVFE